MTALALAFTALAAIAAAIYGLALCWRDPSWMRTWVKTASVGALALAATGFAAPPLVVWGLALGAVGDFCLSRAGQRAFLAGMAAFAAGHLAYAAEFWSSGALPAPLPALALLALGASTEVWLAPRTGTLRWPVRGYVVVITLMALAALTLGPDRKAALTGAVLFVASDLLLAIDLFVATRPAVKRGLGHALWAAYWSGQALILWGMSGRPPF